MSRRIRQHKKDIQRDFVEQEAFVMGDEINYINTLKIPKPSQQVHYISGKAVESISLIKQIIKEKGIISELICLIFSINTPNAEMLIALKRAGHIKHIEITVSTIRNKAEKENVKSYHKLLQGNDIILKHAYNHAKVILAKTENDYIVINTSANFVNSAKYEFFVISNNKQLYDYYKKCIKNLQEIT